MIELIKTSKKSVQIELFEKTLKKQNQQRFKPQKKKKKYIQ